MTAIAHFSIRKALLPMGGLLAIIVLLLFETLDIRQIESHGQFWLTYMAIGWACEAVVLLLIFAFFRQYFFYKRRAVWIEDGNIIYLDKRWLCVPCDAVESVSRTSYGPLGQTAVTLKLRDGNTRTVGTGTICERPEAIIERLHRVICGPGSLQEPHPPTGSG